MLEIEVIDLTKEYDGHPAVDSLNFSLESGKIYGFLGPNGAGKSTTMNMITGCLSSTSGTVLVHGHDIYEEQKEAKRHIGYLPEIPPLYLDMTAEEYLRFVCEIKGIRKAERPAMIDNVLERTGTAHVRHRLMRHLSKGYRQRVGIAQALVGYPEIIIFDEPTVGLDPLQIIEIRELIRDLGKEHTVFLSSHILSEVSELCDELIIIANGKLVARDTPERLSEIARGGTHLHLCAQADQKAVEGVLNSIEEIHSHTCRTGEENQTEASLLVREDCRSKVFFAFAEAGIPLLEMRRESTTLEEVFLSFVEPAGDKEVEDDGRI